MGKSTSSHRNCCGPAVWRDEGSGNWITRWIDHLVENLTHLVDHMVGSSTSYLHSRQRKVERYQLIIGIQIDLQPLNLIWSRSRSLNVIWPRSRSLNLIWSRSHRGTDGSDKLKGEGGGKEGELLFQPGDLRSQSLFSRSILCLFSRCFVCIFYLFVQTIPKRMLPRQVTRTPTMKRGFAPTRWIFEAAIGVT